MSIPTAPAHEFKGIKDALVFAKLLSADKAGRGRPSQEMKDNAKMLVRDHSYRIAGYSVKPAAKASESTPTAAPAKVERKPRAAGKEIAEPTPQMRGEDLIPMADGKPWKLGIRGTCNQCRISLTHCPCPKPMVWLDHKTEVAVTFAKAKV